MLPIETSCHQHVCRKGKLCGSFCLQMGGLRPPRPPHCFKTIHASNRKHHAIAMFAGKKSCADHVVCQWGRLPPNPPAVFKNIHASNKKRHVITMLAGKGKLCGAFCLQMEGLRPPPNPPAVLKLSMLPIKSIMSSTCLQFAGKQSCADHFVCKCGGCAPPNPPVVLKPPMLAKQMKHHVITMFAVRGGCADHFVIYSV